MEIDCIDSLINLFKVSIAMCRLTAVNQSLALPPLFNPRLSKALPAELPHLHHHHRQSHVLRFSAATISRTPPEWNPVLEVSRILSSKRLTSRRRNCLRKRSYQKKDGRQAQCCHHRYVPPAPRCRPLAPFPLLLPTLPASWRIPYFNVIISIFKP